jgi:hypothetical protein
MPRVHERTGFLAEIVLESASGKRQARISDISVGGCYVDTITTVSVGDKVKFDLVHPNGGHLMFEGEVAYHFNGVGFGLGFTDLSEEQKQFLERIAK